MTLGDGIRRNITTVSAGERNRFRDAIITLNHRFYPGTRDDTPNTGGVSHWFKQDEIHQATHVHGGPAFLPWHRELCNRFEALLRQVDPQLSLHYWDYTTDPRPLFTADFMGQAEGAAGEPWRSNGFYDPGAANYRSDDPFDMDHHNPADPPHNLTRGVAPGAPPVGGSSWPTEATILGAMTFPQMRLLLEPAHDSAHGYIGGNLGASHISFRDPFVFLLHSNIDRLFAMWQSAAGQSWRLDPVAVYGSETSDPSLNDPLEPWAGGTGTRPWAAPENQVQSRTCLHPSVVQPPCYDTMPVCPTVIDFSPFENRWAAIVRLLFGVSNDGPGVVIGPDGKPHPVDPWGPLVARLDPAKQQILAGMAVTEIAALIPNNAAQAQLHQAGVATMAGAVKELQKRQVR